MKRILNSKWAFTVFFGACLLFYGVRVIVRPTVEEMLYVVVLTAAIGLRWNLFKV